MASPGQCLLRQISGLPLHDRSARRQAITAANKLISQATSADPPGSGDSSLKGASHYAACDVIKCLIGYHDDAQKSNGGVCRLGRFHQLLHVASVVAFKWALVDTALVCHLISAIANCEATLERLFAPAIFGTRVTYLISGVKSDLDNQEECLKLGAYFLHHASVVDLEVTVNYDQNNRPGWERTYRVVDLPLLSYDVIPPLHAAVRLQQAPAVQLLLRYGAKLDFIPVTGDVPDDDDVRYQPIKYLCHCLNSETAAHVVEGAPYNEANILCLRQLLRAHVLKLPLRVTSAAAAETDAGLHYTIVAQEPRLAQLTGVRPLRHLSRCAIRCRLGQLGRLPNGIQRLSLPESLRNYVDLAED